MCINKPFLQSTEKRDHSSKYNFFEMDGNVSQTLSENFKEHPLTNENSLTQKIVRLSRSSFAELAFINATIPSFFYYSLYIAGFTTNSVLYCTVIMKLKCHTLIRPRIPF